MLYLNVGACETKVLLGDLGTEMGANVQVLCSDGLSPLVSLFPVGMAFIYGQVVVNDDNNDTISQVWCLMEKMRSNSCCRITDL